MKNKINDLGEKVTKLREIAEKAETELRDIYRTEIPVLADLAKGKTVELYSEISRGERYETEDFTILNPDGIVSGYSITTTYRYNSYSGGSYETGDKFPGSKTWNFNDFMDELTTWWGKKPPVRDLYAEKRVRQIYDSLFAAVKDNGD